ncbi:hypothetical protein PAHAL_7G271600 [Panicum hallii]|uniref:Uncharacterized protein n=1 Tax=Panicum hallii TaxID=206008 RepID=A0A2T8IDK4_9POAL|nr:hypothetical protein PAHAL_7G271600 [Panicum hallii]
MAAPSAALSVSGAAHTNTFGCRNNKLKSNKNRLQVAVPSSSESTNYCRKLTICRAQSEDSKGGGGFLAGFLIGGALFGTLGYVFAPQISRTLDSLLDENGQDSESDETGLQRVPGPRRGQYYDEGLEIEISSLNDNEHVVENLNEHGFVQGESAT